MKKGKMAQAVAAVTALLLVAVLISFYLSMVEMEPAGTITLPSSQGSISADSDKLGENGPLVDGVQVDASNVLNVIAALHRPKEYTYELESTLSYHSAEDVLRIKGAVQGRRSHIQQLSESGAVEKEIIIAPSGYYAWRSGQVNPYVGTLGQGISQDGELTAFYDDASRVPTYEAVLELDPSQILEAGYVEQGGEACIYVKVENPLAGTQDSYYIAVSTGLLYRAESEKDGMTTYSMKLTRVTVEDVPESRFQLPNGQMVEEE